MILFLVCGVVLCVLLRAVLGLRDRRGWLWVGVRAGGPRVVLPGYGGAAGGAVSAARRLLRVFGGMPAAARRSFSACRWWWAVRMRWLRTARAQASQSMVGARPMSRHQPRAMLVVAGSLMVEKARSALVRRA